MRIIFLFFVLLFSTVVGAACKYYTITGSSERFPTREAACNDWGDRNYQGAEGISFFIGTDGFCMIRTSNKDIRGPGISEANDPECNKCADGATSISTMNITRGWARSPLPNKSDQIGKTSDLPSSICQDGCKYGVLANSNSYRSQTPSVQGLYRLSSDVTVIQTDQSCTPSESDQAANPNTPDLKCPGQLGELDGKPFCAVDPGNTGVTPNGQPGPPESLDDKGNPQAGKKPDSGEGSGDGGKGRTPENGNGGNQGGPAGAAAGGSGSKPGEKAPDGKTDKEDGKEQQACGAPGQPKCGIDETGTPREFNSDGKGQGVDQWKSTMDQQREEIKSAGDGVFGSLQVLFSAPPMTSCGPIALPKDVTVTRHCDVVDGVRGAMAYIWALSALWLCIGWIREAV